MYPNQGKLESSWKIPQSEEPIKIPKSSQSPVRILYVWSLVFLGMFLYAFVWFVLGLPLVYLIDAVRNSLTITDPMWNTVVDFIMLCFEIHPIISLVGWFIYGILNSAKRDVDTWRTY
jgi:hypothetical protein